MRNPTSLFFPDATEMLASVLKETEPAVTMYLLNAMK